MTATATTTERSQLLPPSLSLAAPFSYSSQAQFKRLFALELCVNLHLHGAVNATQTRSRSKKFNAASPHTPPLPLPPPLPLAVPVCTSLNWLSIAKQTQNSRKQNEKKDKSEREWEKTQLNLFQIFELPLLLLLLLGIWYDMLISKCLHIYSIWLTCSCCPINRSVWGVEELWLRQSVYFAMFFWFDLVRNPICAFKFVNIALGSALYVDSALLSSVHTRLSLSQQC